MKDSIFQSFINAFVENINKNNKVVDCTYRFKESIDANFLREININCSAIDLRVYYSNKFYYEIFLSDENQSSKLVFQIKSQKKQIDILIDFTKGDGKGYVNIYVPCVEKFYSRIKKSDLVINSIESDVIQVENKSGDIVVNDMRVKDGVFTEESGDIVLNCNRYDYKYDLKSRNGNVICNGHNNLKSSNQIKCRNTNGDIILNA